MTSVNPPISTSPSSPQQWSKDEIDLDSTLRYLYRTLRHCRALLVAIEFKHRGKLWRADTAKEAIELRQQLEAEDRALIDAGEIPDDYSEEDVWTPDAVVDLLKGVGERQKRFIKLLFEENEILSAKVVKKLGLSSEVALAGALS